MFNNIGKKLKMLAKIFFGILTVAALVVAIVMFDKADWDADDLRFFIGIACVIVGPLLAWLLNAAFYGFGELVDSVSAIKVHLIGGIDTRVQKAEALRAKGMITEEEYQNIVSRQG